MSRFDTSIFILKTTGHPLFARMAETREALPLAKGAREAIEAELPSGMSAEDRGVILQAVRTLAGSSRYLRACLAADAMRHSLDGEQVEPVSDGERAWANASLKRRESYIAQALQRKKKRPRPTRKPTDAPSGRRELLLALADRVEREGASRELDEAIWIAAGEFGYFEDFMALSAEQNTSPWFTSSIDAAKTLVPKGFYSSSDSDMVARVMGPEDPPGFVPEGISDNADTKTKACALTAAALRAIAAMEKDE